MNCRRVSPRYQPMMLLLNDARKYFILLYSRPSNGYKIKNRTEHTAHPMERAQWSMERKKTTQHNTTTSIIAVIPERRTWWCVQRTTYILLCAHCTYKRWLTISSGREKNSHKNNCLSFSCANVDVYYTRNTGTKLKIFIFMYCHCFLPATVL